MLQRLEVLHLLSGGEDMVFRRSELHGLFALPLGAGENNDLTAHGSCQLNGQVAQTTDAHDTDPVCGPEPVFGQTSPDCGTGAHQGRRVGGVIAVRDLEDVAGIPDDAVAEGTEVVVVESVFLLVGAVLIPACWYISYGHGRENIPAEHTADAVIANPTDFMCVSESNTVTDLDVCHSIANLSNNPDALVAKNLARMQVVLVCAAETGMCRFDVDVRRAKGTGRLIRDDLALLGATVYVKGDAHVDSCDVRYAGKAKTGYITTTSRSGRRGPALYKSSTLGT